MKKILSVIIFALLALFTTQAAGLSGVKVYIDPGHGSYGYDDRPVATIAWPMLSSTGRPEPGKGFYESHTNLWKAEKLEEMLKAAGAKTSMSHRTCGGTTDGTTHNPTLAARRTEATNWGANFFISIHSNASGSTTDDGYTVNYLALIYAGHSGVASSTQSRQKAAAEKCWPYVFEFMGESDEGYLFEPKTHWTYTSMKVVSQSLGVLRHTITGFLSEGFFHSYQPSCHRALSKAWCRQEGVRYYRGIANYYGQAAETKGYISGMVKRSDKKMTRSKTIKTNTAQWFYQTGTHDQFQPCNGATVYLYNSAKTQILKTFTTDNNWNGCFVFENLTPGTYYLGVKASGCGNVEEKYRKVTVTANKTSYALVFMKAGTFNEANEPVSGGGTTDPGTQPETPTTGITVTPNTEVVMSATVGQTTAAPYKDVKVVGTGLTSAMSVNSNTGSLTVTKLSGWDDLTGGTLRLTVNVNFSKGAGTYDSFVAIQSTSAYRVELPVLITLNPSGTTTPTPAITVNPTSLSFSGTEGTAIASQKVTVTGSNLTVAPTVSGATDKFTVTPSLTTTGGTITVAPKTTLAAGTHTGTITVTADGVSKTISLTATITAKQTTDPTPETGTPDATYGNVKFYLQGGKLDVPADNAALWELFKPAYNTYYGLNRADQPIANVSTFCTPNMKDFLTNAKSEWNWLGGYIIGLVPEMASASEDEWRWTVHSFFNCTDPASSSVWGEKTYGKGSWTTAGKPVAWKAAYTFAHKPTKTNDTFLGWYNNATASGSALTACPTSGSVYACWKNTTTSLEELSSVVSILPTYSGVELLFNGTQTIAIYNVNGTMIANGVSTDYYACDLQSGMYIIRIGNEVHKFVK